jgi:hypothetical protein
MRSRSLQLIAHVEVTPDVPRLLCHLLYGCELPAPI